MWAISFWASSNFFSQFSPKYWAIMFDNFSHRPNITNNTILLGIQIEFLFLPPKTLGENACYLVTSPKRWAKIVDFLLSRPNVGRKRLCSYLLAQILGEGSWLLVISPKTSKKQGNSTNPNLMYSASSTPISRKPEVIRLVFSAYS